MRTETGYQDPVYEPRAMFAKLAQWVFKIPSFRAMYTKYMHEFLTIVTPEKLKQRIELFQPLITHPVRVSVFSLLLSSRSASLSFSLLTLLSLMLRCLNTTITR